MQTRFHIIYPPTPPPPIKQSLPPVHPRRRHRHNAATEHVVVCAHGIVKLGPTVRRPMLLVIACMHTGCVPRVSFLFVSAEHGSFVLFIIVVVIQSNPRKNLCRFNAFSPKRVWRMKAHKTKYTKYLPPIRRKPYSRCFLFRGENSKMADSGVLCIYWTTRHYIRYTRLAVQIFDNFYVSFILLRVVLCVFCAFRARPLRLPSPPMSRTDEKLPDLPTARMTERYRFRNVVVPALFWSVYVTTDAMTQP